MKVEQGDLWEKHQEGHHICIPVNKERKSGGEAVMGAGLANEARLIFPQLPRLLGDALNGRVQWQTGFFMHLPAYRLFLLATKTDWRKPSELAIIDSSCASMAAALKSTKTSLIAPIRYPVYLPKLGCGCGKLKWPQVAPVISKHLNDDFVVLI